MSDPLITDVDEAPEFDERTARDCYVPETSPAGTNLGQPISCTVLLTHSLYRMDAGSFDINAAPPARSPPSPA